MKKIICLLLAAALLLCGCAFEGEDPEIEYVPEYVEPEAPKSPLNEFGLDGYTDLVAFGNYYGGYDGNGSFKVFNKDLEEVDPQRYDGYLPENCLSRTVVGDDLYELYVNPKNSKLLSIFRIDGDKGSTVIVDVEIENNPDLDREDGLRTLSDSTFAYWRRAREDQDGSKSTAYLAMIYGNGDPVRAIDELYYVYEGSDDSRGLYIIDLYTPGDQICALSKQLVDGKEQLLLSYYTMTGGSAGTLTVDEEITDDENYTGVFPIGESVGIAMGDKDLRWLHGSDNDMLVEDGSYALLGDYFVYESGANPEKINILQPKSGRLKEILLPHEVGEYLKVYEFGGGMMVEYSVDGTVKHYLLTKDEIEKIYA